jgi:multiple sugar transport system ATP-binding protein
MADVELKNVWKTFSKGTVEVLRDLNLRIPDGIFATVLGPSGCGKTTLLRVVAGLEAADGGEVLIGGRTVNRVSPSERNIAMVFQNYALYPHKKAYENISIGLKLRRFPGDEVRRKVAEVSSILRIETLLERYPRELSGGQQQRVALARALVRNPEVFLLDEPLSNLDAQVRESTRTELKKLFKSLNATVLYVTHDQIEAMMMSDLVIVMDNGAIRQVGEPTSVYRNPFHRFVAEFIGAHRINMIEGRIEKERFISADGAIAFDVKFENQEKAWLGIRPEYIVVNGMKGIQLKGEAVLVEPLGSSNLVSVKLKENEIKVLSLESCRLHDTITLSFSADDVYFFDGQEGDRLKIRQP